MPRPLHRTAEQLTAGDPEDRVGTMEGWVDQAETPRIMVTLRGRPVAWNKPLENRFPGLPEDGADHPLAEEIQGLLHLVATSPGRQGLRFTEWRRPWKGKALRIRMMVDPDLLVMKIEIVPLDDP